MKVGDLIILDEREVGGAWNEYLCLEKTSEGYELSTRHREILGDESDYYDEEGDIELPDEIDGESVYGSVNGIILGESLLINDFLNCGEKGKGSIKFNDVNFSYTERKVLNNINLLSKESTFTITTGHQLNILTGPIFFIYKIISIINVTIIRPKYIIFKSPV